MGMKSPSVLRTENSQAQNCHIAQRLASHARDMTFLARFLQRGIGVCLENDVNLSSGL
jgi:hypothetical protein